MRSTSLIHITCALLALTACNNDDSSSDTGAAGLSGAPAPDDDEDEADDDDDEVDNMAACEDFVADLECDGGIDISMSVPCDQFGAYTCDLTEYFDCVADAWSCDPAEIDSAGLSSCAAQLTCS